MSGPPTFLTGKCGPGHCERDSFHQNIPECNLTHTSIDESPDYLGATNSLHSANCPKDSTLETQDAFEG